MINSDYTVNHTVAACIILSRIAALFDMHMRQKMHFVARKL